jgi:hypothetical protein
MVFSLCALSGEVNLSDSSILVCNSANFIAMNCYHAKIGSYPRDIAETMLCSTGVGANMAWKIHIKLIDTPAT